MHLKMCGKGIQKCCISNAFHGTEDDAVWEDVGSDHCSYIPNSSLSLHNIEEPESEGENCSDD